MRAWLVPVTPGAGARTHRELPLCAEEVSEFIDQPDDKTCATCGIVFGVNTQAARDEVRGSAAAPSV